MTTTTMTTTITTTTTTCPEARERIDDLLDGALAPAEAAALAAHLDGCPGCRGERDAQAALLAEARRLPLGRLPRHDLWSGVAARLDEASPGRPGRLSSWAAAGALVLALGAGWRVVSALDLPAGTDVPAGSRGGAMGAPGASGLAAAGGLDGRGGAGGR